MATPLFDAPITPLASAAAPPRLRIRRLEGHSVPRWGLTLLLAALAWPAAAQESSSAVGSSTEMAGTSSTSASASASASAPLMPAGLGDADLELVVRAAYAAAIDFAAANGNYFARDEVVEPLHAAIAGALAITYPSVVVSAATIGGGSAKTCLTRPGTELRVSSNIFGDGVWLTAVTDTRLFGYVYDPHENTEIAVQKATACSK